MRLPIGALHIAKTERTLPKTPFRFHFLRIAHSNDRVEQTAAFPVFAGCNDDRQFPALAGLPDWTVPKS